MAARTRFDAESYPSPTSPEPSDWREPGKCETATSAWCWRHSGSFGTVFSCWTRRPTRRGRAMKMQPPGVYRILLTESQLSVRLGDQTIGEVTSQWLLREGDGPALLGDLAEEHACRHCGNA
jgi:hypothetical protein